MGGAVLQYTLYLGILVALGIPLGKYMGKVMNGEKTFLSKILLPCEDFLYKMLGIDKNEEMGWKKYMVSALLFNLIGFLCLWLLLLCQGGLPFNPEGQKGLSWFLSFNTAASFTTNTNWQCYNAENTLSYLSQAMGLLVQNFVSAATGIAVMFAMIRAFFKFKEKGLGSFWTDMVRIHLYILIPICIVAAIAIGSQGVTQSLKPSDTVALLEPILLDANGDTAGIIDTDTGAVILSDGAILDGAVIDSAKNEVTVNGEFFATIVDEQLVPLGPAASQIAMKQLGTNGGGFYGLNSTHPLENPTHFSNMIEMIFLLLIPVGLCFTFGRNINNKKQGYAIFAAMFIVLVAALAVVAVNEHPGTPQLGQNGAVYLGTDGQAGGNMEGKETRFGIASSATWCVWTTAASNGSVNSMHDSYTPLGGLVPMLLMQLGEVIFGGVGCGLYGMISFAILTVFIAGLMVGRTPEFLGKKIEPYEMKWASLVCLATPIGILVGSGIAAALTSTHDSLNNPGMHGFSELIYAYSSGGGNNGSAFAGFNSNTPFIATSHGLVMIFVRFLPLIGTLAISGSLVEKKRVATTVGTLSTTNAMFVFLLIFIVLLIGALSFLPALALGPIAEHFSRIIW